MKITVPATDSELMSLLSQDQKELWGAAIPTAGKKQIIFQNLHTSYDVYLEIGSTAAVATGIKIPAINGKYTWEGDEYPEFQLISDGGSNDDFRIGNN